MAEEINKDIGDLLSIVDAVLITSLTVNACCLLTAIVSVVLRRASGSGRDSKHNERRIGDHCQKSGISSNSAKVGCDERTSGNVQSWHVTCSAVEVFLSLACAVGGLAVMTSSVTWSNPFFVDVATSAHNVSRAIMAAALGRFLFSLVSLLLQLSSPGRWDVDKSKSRDLLFLDNTARKSTAGFRVVYVFASVVCLASTVIQQSNYLLASIILFLEIDQVPLFDAVHCFGSDSRSVSARRYRVVQLVLGFVCLTFRFVLPSTLVGVAATHVQGITVLSPFQLGIMCFEIVFFSLCSMFVLRLLRPRQLIRRRCRAASDDSETAMTSSAATTAAFGKWSTAAKCLKPPVDGRCRVANSNKSGKLSGAVSRGYQRRQDHGCCRKLTGTSTVPSWSRQHSKLSRSLKLLIINGHVLLVDNVRAAFGGLTPPSE